MAVQDIKRTGISVPDLIALSRSGQPHAIIDTREQAGFGAGHLLYSSNMPLSRLELIAPNRLPNRHAPLVLVDADAGRIDLARQRLAAIGFTDLRVLEGGPEGWAAAGYRLHIGTNVPSKLLGEHVAEAGVVDMIRPEMFTARLQDRDGTSVWDCRTLPEFMAGSLPGAIHVPGTSWTSQVGDDIDRPLVITCAGRTRGVIATRTLAMFGGARDVTWVEDGLAGWSLSGHETVLPAPEPTGAKAPTADLPTAHRRISDMAMSKGVATISAVDLQKLYDTGAPAYYFDVSTLDHERRDAGAVSCVPGGQLVQTADDHIPQRNIPVILFDDPAGEALIAAYWLGQLGYLDVRVAVGCSAGDFPSTQGQPPLRHNADGDIERVDCATARQLAARPDTLLVDVSSRMQFRASHPRGAVHCNRTSLGDLIAARKPRTVLMTAQEMPLAELAATDLGQPGLRVVLVSGGTLAWADLPGECVAADADTAVEIDDYPPPDAPLPDKLERLRAYIAWELELTDLSLNDALEPAGFASDYVVSAHTQIE